MDETIKRKLTPTETITNSIPKIIEAFVMFYGESEREKITQKFNDFLVVGYIPPDTIKSNLRNINNVKSDVLKTELFSKITGIHEINDDLNNVIFDNYSLEYESLHPINKYIKYKNDISKTYLKKDVLLFIQKIYPNTTEENLDKLLEQEYFKKIDELVIEYKKIINQYKDHLNKYLSYYEYINKCDDLKKSLEKKYIKKLVEELRPLLNDDEYSNIQSMLHNDYYSTIQNISPKTKNYFGYSLNNIPLIDCFSKENEEVLLNGADWKIRSIKKDRIQYFKNLGLDLGDDYYKYTEYPDIDKYIPSKDIVEKITTTIKQMHTEKMNEYFTSLPEYIENRTRIEKKELLDKEDGYDAKMYENVGTGITTNIKVENGEYILYPLLIFGINDDTQYFDHRLIHEFNHIYESYLINVLGNDYSAVSGWDVVTGKINNSLPKNVSLEEKQEKRDYELFNEIINELISQEISQIMTDMDIYVFNNKNDKKIKHGTSYERMTFLVYDFYETYKKEIIASRKNNNISIIFNAVGKENFEELNNLFHEFNEHFSVLSTYYEMLKNYKNSIETEETIIFKRILEKEENILQKMREYNMKNVNKI